MTVKWNGTNLLKTIAENEAGATKFYRAIAEEARIGEKFFELLAQDEEKHEKIYNALLKRFEKNIEIELEESDAKYMDLLIEANNPFDNELIEKAKKIWDRRQIFEIAEQAERDAVLFVSELQRLYPDMAAEEMAIILKEEKSHLQKVLERKRESQPMFGRGM
ncbi:ferritin family protein [Sedimentibacter sp.]|uniref:ferritin family protein n=2 Tax=Sedimentibacter sp. TaxID=1960295 RepID=UPI0028A9B3DA|nr:ferritin family protein [Sedimentibacter sp.]